MANSINRTKTNPAKPRPPSQPPLPNIIIPPLFVSNTLYLNTKNREHKMPIVVLRFSLLYQVFHH